MTNKEFVEKILGITLIESRLSMKCDYIQCTDSREMPCDTCHLYGFWGKEVDWGKVYSALMSSDIPMHLQKGLLNNLYGKAVYADTDSIKELDPWTEVPMKVLSSNLTYNIAEILDDATVNGLDFKYENGKYFYKERQAVPN